MGQITEAMDGAKNSNSTLLIKEALYIWLSDLQLINRDGGITIPECWLQVMNCAAVMMSPTHATPTPYTIDGG